jgi:hypothetical protein
MIGLALIVTVTATAWTIWEGAKQSLRRLPRIAATPVAVEEEQVVGVEEKVRMLDEIFSAAPFPKDDEVDPPTVVAPKR